MKNLDSSAHKYGSVENDRTRVLLYMYVRQQSRRFITMILLFGNVRFRRTTGFRTIVRILETCAQYIGFQKPLNCDFI